MVGGPQTPHSSSARGGGDQTTPPSSPLRPSDRTLLIALLPPPVSEGGLDSPPHPTLTFPSWVPPEEGGGRSGIPRRVYTEDSCTSVTASVPHGLPSKTALPRKGGGSLLGDSDPLSPSTPPPPPPPPLPQAPVGAAHGLFPLQPQSPRCRLGPAVAPRGLSSLLPTSPLPRGRGGGAALPQ